MDSIFGIGGNELIIIIILAMVVLGPEKVVRSARTVGKLVRDIKSYFTSFTSELKSELDILDEIKEIKEVKDIGLK